MARHVLTLALLLVIGTHVDAASDTPGTFRTVRRLAPPLGCDRLTIADGLPNSNVRAIVQDGRGFIWFGTQDGLARYDGHKLRVYRTSEDDPATLSSGYITTLDVDPSGTVWVGTAEHGISAYDPAKDKFTRFERVKGGGEAEGITASVRDAKNRVWFALSSGGLRRADAGGTTFTDFLTEPVDTVITAISQDTSGNLWLGTATEGVIRWNPETGATARFRPATGADTTVVLPITAILASAKGTVWIGSDEGLFALEPATGKIVRHVNVAGDPATISDDHISVLFEDKDQSLWIGTSSGLNRREPGGRIVQHQHDPNDPSSLPSPGIESIYQSADGVMWIGGFTVGVCKFDEFRLKFGHHRTRTHANSFFEDTDGTLWVGTYNDGLHKYERAAQRVTVYRTPGRRADASGQPAVALDAGWIAAMQRDRRGTLWIALKGHGLIAFDTKEETYRQYLPDPDDPNSLPVDTMFDIWEDERGMLWLATWGGGLVRFDPAAEVFTAYTTEVGDEATRLTSNHLYNLYPDPADKSILWVGAAKGGVMRFNMATGMATSYRHEPENPAIHRQRRRARDPSRSDGDRVARDLRRWPQPPRSLDREGRAVHDQQLEDHQRCGVRGAPR